MNGVMHSSLQGQSADGYCGHCGEAFDGGEVPASNDHRRCREQLVLEPPRYCGRCRRRMKVQVTPLGWTAQCSRHVVLIRCPATLELREFVGGRGLNISIGIAPAGPGDTAETMLDAADMAMYQAKNAGGDRSAVRDSRTQAAATARLNLESDLRLALVRNELRLHYQPVIDLKTGTPVGFEALLRWEHPTRGLLEPASFISQAEDSGLIVPIGSWVLNQALQQTQQWRNTLPGAKDLTISVNVSVRQLQDLRFVDTVRDALGTTGISPGAVTLEITESVLMDQSELPTAIVQGLHACGVGLAIDDFGTGYSSLSHLRWLSAHTLKIDKSFVAELGYKNPSSASIIQLILGMARVLNLSVIAEGVETPAQLNELRRLGVRHAQGYLWCEPLPAHEIPKQILNQPFTGTDQ